MPAPLDIPPSPRGSLRSDHPIDYATSNGLCGLDGGGRGTYTAEGITQLCKGLKGSAVTSLKCAATPQSVCFCVTAP